MRVRGAVTCNWHMLLACRLEDAIMAIVASGDKSLLTPDIGGTGTTASFTNAVIKSVKP